MKIRYMSDLHLEFADFDVPPQDDDKDQILVLAGDVGVVESSSFTSRYIPFLKRVNEQFRTVILIMGNHEHYGGSFLKTAEKLREALKSVELTNIVFLEKATHVIDDVAFIGATLWTDCDKNSPHASHYFNYMNDGRVIRTGPNKEDGYKLPFRAADTATDHARAKRFIEGEIEAQKKAGKKVAVVVHHGVAPGSIAEKYRTGPSAALNMFFASDMTKLWKKTEPDLIIHGHTHESLDYTVGKTRVAVNPRGYVTHNQPAGENSKFDPRLTVEI